MFFFISSAINSENNMTPLTEYMNNEIDSPNVTPRKMIYVNLRCIALHQALWQKVGSNDKGSGMEKEIKENILLFMNSGFVLYSKISSSENIKSDDLWQDYIDSVATNTDQIIENYNFELNKNFQNTGNILDGEFLKNDFKECTTWKNLIGQAG